MRKREGTVEGSTRSRDQLDTVDKEVVLKMTPRYLAWMTKYLLILITKIKRAEGKADLSKPSPSAPKKFNSGA